MLGVILGKRYEILEKLGGGGMSIVYLGRDIILNRFVTIKILREQFAGDDDFVRKFQREAQAVASVSHPNIVSLYDVGNQDDWHYLIMEYVEGKTLKDVIKERAPLPPHEAIYFAQQICDALSHAHNKGIIHRDIKPHNILVTNNGRMKVTDFGIARAISSATQTYSGNMVGSVHYISPEQAKGAISDEKSDIYSLGVVLFEMLTGSLPFEGDSPIAVAIQHIQNDPPHPSTLNQAVSEKLSAIILKALAKLPEKRFGSALEMRWELQQALDISTEVAGEFDTIYDEHTLIAPAIEIKDNEEKEEITSGRRLKPAVGWGLAGLVVVLLLFLVYRTAVNFLVVPVIKVPDVTGKPYSSAKIILKKAGLLSEYNKIYSEKVPQDYVISQTPDANMEVKQGRIITLLISEGAKLVEVPKLLKKTRSDAENDLQNAGFVMQIDEEFNDSVDADTIFDQSPQPGAMVAEGSLIKMKVSKGGKPQYVSMPDIKGKTLDEAKKEINSVGLKIGVIGKKESTEFFPWEVISQDVEPFASIQKGSSVNLVVSEGPGPTSQAAHVTIPLPDDGAMHQVKIIVIDTKGTHEEYNDNNQSGEIIEKDIPYFGKGKIQVFIDDVLAFEQPVE